MYFGRHIRPNIAISGRTRTYSSKTTENVLTFRSSRYRINKCIGANYIAAPEIYFSKIEM